MIDPAQIRNTPINHSQDEVFEMNAIPDFDQQAYDLTDEKDFQRYISDIEKEVRSSFEYKQMIQYFKDNMEMNRCAFLQGTTIDPENRISIEIHHYPFTLYDLCIIIYNKREHFGESMEVQMVAKEVMQRHYELLVGLIPLSKTVHELAHSENIFIPVDRVLGNWHRFMNIYSDFFTPEQADVIQRIVEYTDNYNKERNEEILKRNIIYLSSNDPRYSLPDLHKVYDSMTNRIQLIKDNQYRMPEITDKEYEAKKAEMQKAQRKKKYPIIYVDNYGMEGQ